MTIKIMDEDNAKKFCMKLKKAKTERLEQQYEVILKQKELQREKEKLRQKDTEMKEIIDEL